MGRNSENPFFLDGRSVGPEEAGKIVEFLETGRISLHGNKNESNNSTAWGKALDSIRSLPHKIFSNNDHK